MDTRYNVSNCDSETSEVSYTIGSGKPEDVDNDKLYYNYWVDYKGERDIPVFELRAQLGEMRPRWCAQRWQCSGSIPSSGRYECPVGDEWCSFGIDPSYPLTPNTALPSEDPNYYVINPSRTNTYPYWKYVFTK